jgi:hypothetical protein
MNDIQRAIPYRAENALFPGTGVTTYALHPGLVQTEFMRYANNSMFNGATWLLRKVTWMAKTPTQGAQTTIYCAVDEKVAGQSGFYYR